jgi:hypothetical protein
LCKSGVWIGRSRLGSAALACGQGGQYREHDQSRRLSKFLSHPKHFMYKPRMNAQHKQTGHYATVNGLKMYYEIHGSGRPMVLLHGGGATVMSTFGRILPEL